MKVRFAFNFGETELRSIRASIGRGGKATRKECYIFVDRAIRTALDKAPEAKAPRARVKREAPTPDGRTSESEAQEHDRLRAQRDRIARMYKHQATEVAHV